LLAVEEGAPLKLKQDPEDFNIVSFLEVFSATNGYAKSGSWTDFSGLPLRNFGRAMMLRQSRSEGV
jgi:hypothetical protein